MSVRRRTFIRNLTAMPREAASRRARVFLDRDQQYVIGGHEVVLPPDSRLPYYQWRDSTYDRYAADLIAAACEGVDSATLIDVGANVGDTAVLVLTSAENVNVVSVEGSDYFLGYLRRNVADLADRVEVVEGFVGPLFDLTTYHRDGGTGGFQRRSDSADETVEVSDWVSVTDLLAKASGDVTIWKTDTDGFDIHLVSQYWNDITSRCEVVWLEYDPVGTLGPKEDITALIQQIADSDREVHVYDNVGHHMCSASGVAAARMLTDLTEWLRARRQGFAPVLYFDIWIATPEIAARMWRQA